MKLLAFIVLICSFSSVVAQDDFSQRDQSSQVIVVYESEPVSYPYPQAINLVPNYKSIDQNGYVYYWLVTADENIGAQTGVRWNLILNSQVVTHNTDIALHTLFKKVTANDICRNSPDDLFIQIEWCLVK